MIKKGAIVIDVGITRTIDPVSSKTKLIGDVHFDGMSHSNFNLNFLFSKFMTFVLLYRSVQYCKIYYSCSGWCWTCNCCHAFKKCISCCPTTEIKEIMTELTKNKISIFCIIFSIQEYNVNF